jgi:hypothetical protein
MAASHCSRRFNRCLSTVKRISFCVAGPLHRSNTNRLNAFADTLDHIVPRRSGRLLALQAKSHFELSSMHHAEGGIHADGTVIVGHPYGGGHGESLKLFAGGGRGLQAAVAAGVLQERRNDSMDFDTTSIETMRGDDGQILAAIDDLLVLLKRRAREWYPDDDNFHYQFDHIINSSLDELKATLHSKNQNDV